MMDKLWLKNIVVIECQKHCTKKEIDWLKKMQNNLEESKNNISMMDKLWFKNIGVIGCQKHCTKEEIREIKTEIKEEEKISDLEVMMEPANDAKGSEMNLAAEVLHEYYRDPEKAEQYCELLKKYHELADQAESEADEEKAIRDILAPAGYATIMARIPQKGKYMLSIKGNDPVTVINIRSQEKEESSWKEFVPDVWSSLGGELS